MTKLYTLIVIAALFMTMGVVAQSLVRPTLKTLPRINTNTAGQIVR